MTGNNSPVCERRPSGLCVVHDKVESGAVAEWLRPHNPGRQRAGHGTDTAVRPPPPPPPPVALAAIPPEPPHRGSGRMALVIRPMPVRGAARSRRPARPENVSWWQPLRRSLSVRSSGTDCQAPARGRPGRRLRQGRLSVLMLRNSPTRGRCKKSLGLPAQLCDKCLHRSRRIPLDHLPLPLRECAVEGRRIRG